MFSYEVNGLFEVDENNSQDTLANDDDAHKAVLCALSLIMCDYYLFGRKWSYSYSILSSNASIKSSLSIEPQVP